ncbi:FAD-linked oxidoreductase [Aaosphaeria arxii CBS 175.79]|uniref:Proline dehydrogenase n=1 Tax=Aaosphaeria arxii CBS 175.79 TaxID=1450172 RepID=A0A6A5XMM6_9PLEO|nr:FAD-linked oxidoreductase [Aaosphaeria arxii CBS 175.79]KAF2014061.1 FAD-linked oxidoreductase [Aaosphaeria arxii CBS 175.79]
MACRIRHLQRLERSASPLFALRRQTQLQASSPLRAATSQILRSVHSTTRQSVSASPLPPSPTQLFTSQTPTTTSPQPPPALLSRLPLSQVLRSYTIMTLSSYPLLLSTFFALLLRILNSTSPLLSIDRNPVLNALLKRTIYAQFCAGETAPELHRTAAESKRVLGYDGVILEYALEVLGGAPPSPAETAAEIETWKKGMLQSLSVAHAGDFIGFKWSGLGRQALRLLQTGQDPSPEMLEAMHSACSVAAERGISLLPGAEEEVTNPGLEAWNLALQKKYNRDGRAVVYTTYQCYLKAIPGRIAAHLATAQREGYVAGVKLVRGAYLTSEPRGLIWDVKEDTDKCYDACLDAVVSQKWNEAVKGEGKFPEVNIVLATHNLPSIEKAQKIRSEQLKGGNGELPRLTYAQLQGMADELTQALLQHPMKAQDGNAKVVKLLTFGTVRECLNFLIRRAAENKEAAGRTGDTARAMGAELLRRLKGVFGGSS